MQIEHAGREFSSFNSQPQEKQGQKKSTRFRASRIVIWATDFGGNSGTMSNPNKRMVGANGFEPSTSWSRARESKILKRCRRLLANVVMGILGSWPKLPTPVGSQPWPWRKYWKDDASPYLHSR